MGKKLAKKTKGKNAYAMFATFSNKAVRKHSNGGKAVKAQAWSSKGGDADAKSTTLQVSSSVATEIHDARPESDIALFPLVEVEKEPLERENELAGQLITEVANDTPDVNALCETYKLRREELGRLTGFSLRALAEWSSGKLPSQPAKRRLQEVRRLLDALAEIVKRERIPQWLHQPNPAFDRLTPLQVIELGEIDRLWTMLHDMGSSQPE